MELLHADELALVGGGHSLQPVTRPYEPPQLINELQLVHELNRDWLLD